MGEDRVQDVYPLYVVHPDGSGRVRLTDYSPGGDDPLAWGPGSRRLAFVGGVQDTDEPSLVVVDVAERSTLALGFPVTGGGPSWAPDGSRLAYVTAVGRHGSAIFTVRPDGRGRRRLALAVPPEAAPAPVWSPDSRRLLFERGSPAPGGRYRESLQIWSMGADGSGERQLTHGYPDGGATFDPGWIRGRVHFKPPRMPVQERLSGGRLFLRLPFPVDGLSADGDRAAVVPATPYYDAVNTPSPPLYMWKTRTGGVMRLVGSPCTSVPEATLAARSLAFDCDQSGTDVVAQSLRVYDLGSRRPTEVFFGHNGGVSLSRGVYLDRIEGGRRLLAFGSEATDRFGRPIRRGVWRIDGDHAVRLHSGPAVGELVSADSGRLAVEGADGRVALLARDGRLLRVVRPPRRRPERRFFFAPRPRRVILTGNRLIVRSGRMLGVYDAVSGALRHAWPFRGTLEAAYGRLAVSVRGRDLYVLDIRDGHSSRLHVPSVIRRFRREYFFEQLVHADLTAAGLFYSFNVDDRHEPGRIVLVPRARLAVFSSP